MSPISALPALTLASLPNNNFPAHHPSTTSSSSTYYEYIAPRIPLRSFGSATLSPFVLPFGYHVAEMRYSRLYLAAMVLQQSVVEGSTLLATHYSGLVYNLLYTPPNSGQQHGNLTIRSSTANCGKKPSWLTVDSTSNAVYCMDEDSSGQNVLASFSSATDGTVKLRSTTITAGGSVHGALYGGSDGKGFFATAE